MKKQKVKPKLEAKQESETKMILVVFSVETLKRIINALVVTKSCHGELLMKDDIALSKIILAIAKGKESVFI